MGNLKTKGLLIAIGYIDYFMWQAEQRSMFQGAYFLLSFLPTSDILAPVTFSGSFPAESSITQASKNMKEPCPFKW